MKGVVHLLVYLLWCCGMLRGNTPDNNQDFDTDLVFEGDLVLTPEQQNMYRTDSISVDSARPQRAVVKEEIAKWPLGVVPYDLSPDLSSSAQNVIMAAMNQFMSDSCIKFKRKEIVDDDYLYFYPGRGCTSSVGRRGGQQNISIGPQCEYKGVVIHEIFHALGRWHEHSRSDRDSYILVNSFNIMPGKVSNFRTISKFQSTNQNITYDYDSIMHYDAFAFSQNDEPTIQPLNDSITLSRLGQRDTFSEQDLKHLLFLYCDSTFSEWSSWSSWSACSQTCGGGMQKRTRTCLGGGECAGSNLSFNPCNHGNCPVVPAWSPWSSWSGCSRTCGQGQRTRHRMCATGDDCEGEKQEFQECTTQECPEVWGPWSEWSLCSTSCEGGVSLRWRMCLKSDGSEAILKCIGKEKEQMPCNVNITCSEDWSECTRTCGGGIQKRRVFGGVVINRTCNEQPCPDVLCLPGVKHIGCCLINNQSDVQPTTSTSGNHDNRTESLRHCAKDALSQGYSYFGLGDGECYIDSDNLHNGSVSTICSAGETLMSVDVYYIYDRVQLSNNSYCSYSNCLEQGDCSGAVKSTLYNVHLLLSWFVCWLLVFR